MEAKLLVPASRSPVVPRARLQARLTEAVRGPLTLVSAPAGSGKTLLVSTWATGGATPGPVVWVSLDEEDGAPGIFWSYVLAGLRRAGVDVTGVHPPERAQNVRHSVLVRLAAVLSQRSGPVVLVLDNVEAVTGPEIFGGLDFLLRHAATRLRLVMITRVDPSLPLPQYRLEGLVTEIRFAELAFTLEESRDLLSARRPGVSDSTALAFRYRTRGWVAGLKLASLPPGEDDGAGSWVGEDIAAYFRSEVLDTQPGGTREVLLCTCVVDEFSAELATYLSRDPEAPAKLRVLAEAGVFAERVPGPDEVYRFNPLVKDLLEAQLQQETPIRKRRLHRRAARWLATSGRTTQALRQYVAAEDWEHACALLVASGAVARLLAGSADAGLGALFSRIPEASPGWAAALVLAGLALLQGDADGCDKHLGRAEELLLPARSRDVPGAELALALITMACAATRAEPDRALTAAARVHGLVTDGGADAATRALVFFCLGRSRLATVQLGEAEELFACAAQPTDDPQTSALRRCALAHLALTRAVSGDPDGAVRAAAEAAGGNPCPCEVPEAEQCGSMPVATDIALAWAFLDRLDLERVRCHLEAVGTSPGVVSDPVAVAAEALVRSRLLQTEGDLDAALRVVAYWRAGRAPGAPDRWARRIDAHEARLLVAQGRPEAAGALVRRYATEDAPECLLAFAWTKLAAGHAAESGRMARQVTRRPGLPLDLLVDAHLLVAASAVAMSHAEAAAAAVDEAERLASAQGLSRSLQDAPPRLRALIRHQGQRRQFQTPSARRTDASTAVLPPPRAEMLGTGSPPTDGVLIEPLTQREREVLVYLDELLPTSEIAARMFVSVNTVKTHIRSILRKLSSERRYEAVRRARNLGLI
ncbi:MAG TPA: LuxR C-terminal-related transcriptional regulator [Kineosporiaceae bacterium]|nr:LuxR C-terminal-related transcriptional regulator [Kineosporiaceae bacterium]